MKEDTIRDLLDPKVRVTLYTNIDIDSDEGFTASNLFEGYVERWVPQTNKLEFRESDIGYAEFCSLVEESHGVEILNEYE